MLTPHVDVCESVLVGRPVLVRQLEPAALRRAFRGAGVPAGEWLTVTAEQLEAIAEGGAFT